MAKRLIVIAGQTGIGKTNIAFELAKKLNTEIILADTVQIYKHLDICANKPRPEYTNYIKYNNLNILELNEKFNAAKYTNTTRQHLNRIWSEGKIPIIEGGSGFYLKKLLSGSGLLHENSENCYEKYENSVRIAKMLIKHDNNFNITLDRACKLDSTLPSFVVNSNDSYRLEKRLADAINYRDGAYQMLNTLESDLKQKENIDNSTEIYKLFYYTDKLRINRILEKRCENMLQMGLLNEINYLLSTDNIKNEIIKLNAYGVKETLTLLKQFINLIPEEATYINACSTKLSKKDEKFHKYKRKIDKLLYNYLLDFATNNRRYAKRQATWFRHNDNFLWINKNPNESTEYVDQITNILEQGFDKYNSIIKDQANKSQKERATDKLLAAKYNPEFKLLEDKQQIQKITTELFRTAKQHKNILENIDELTDQPLTIDYELIKQYLI